MSNNSPSASPEHPYYIPMPPPMPLRSAMKHSSSRPSTPSQTPNSPSLRASASPNFALSGPYIHNPVLEHVALDFTSVDPGGVTRHPIPSAS